MCFQTVRALSCEVDAGEGVGVGGFVVVAVIWLGFFAVHGAVVVVVFLIGWAVAEGGFWGLEILAGVPVESMEPRERVDGWDCGACSNWGEQGAVLNCSEGVGESASESASREVSEIKMEGFSAVSRERDLCAQSWLSKVAHTRLTGCSFDAAVPR